MSVMSARIERDEDDQLGLNIDNEYFKVYLLDTIETLYQRIAVGVYNNARAAMYFYSPDIEDISKLFDPNMLDETIIIYNILEISSGGNNIKAIDDLLKNITETETIEDALLLLKYKNYNGVYQPIAEYFRSLKGAKNSQDRILAESIRIFGTDMTAKIQSAMLSVEASNIVPASTMREIAAFEQIEPSLYVSLIVHKLKKQIVFKSDLTILQLFNRITATVKIPYIYYKNFYKLYTYDSEGSSKWSMYSKFVSKPVSLETILIVVQIGESFKTLKIRENSGGLYELTTSVDVGIGKGREYENVNNEINQLAFSIFENIGCEVDIASSNDKKIRMSFILPNININNYVLADMIWLKNIFKRYISINESTSTTKTSGNSFLIFDISAIPNVRTSMINNVLQNRYDPYVPINLKQGPDAIMGRGSFYSRVTVKNCKTYDEVLMFLQIFGRFITLYMHQAAHISNEYAVISKQTVVLDTVQPPIEMFKEKTFSLYKEKFPVTYAQSCSKSRKPSVATADADPSNIVDFAGVKWTCTSPEYPFIGNQRISADKVPCCFKNKQPKLDKAVKSHASKTIISSFKKMLSVGSFGTVPVDMVYMFKEFDIGELTKSSIENRYFRMGVSTGDCLGSIMQVLDIDDTQQNVRTRMAHDRKLIIARQQFYDSDIDHVKNILLDTDTPLEMSMFLPFFEDYFECNIFVFTYTYEKDCDGVVSMMIPRYKESYIRYVHYDRCILLYTNLKLNSKSGVDRYEALVSSKYDTYSSVRSKNKSVFAWTEKDGIFKGCYRLFGEMYTFITLPSTAVLTNQKQPVFDIAGINIEKQYIDSKGKTRGLLLSNNNGNLLYVHTKPIIPIAGIDTIEDIDARIDNVKAQRFFDNIEPKKIKTFKKTVVKIIRSFDSKQDMDTLEDQHQMSKLDMYNMYRKTANILVQYAVWAFSRVFFSRPKVVDTSISDMLQEYSPYIQVRQDVIYSIESRMSIQFEKSDWFNPSTNILYVDSADLKNRLMYAVYSEYISRRDQVVSYHTRTMIPDLLIDTLDFTRSPNQIILHGHDTVVDFIEHSKIRTSPKMYIFPVINERNLYFINVFEGEYSTIYLSYNIAIVEQAYVLVEAWSRSDYKIVETVRDDTDLGDYKTDLSNSNKVNIILSDNKQLEYEKTVREIKPDSVNIFKTINYDPSKIIAYLPKVYQPIALEISKCSSEWCTYVPKETETEIDIESENETETETVKSEEDFLSEMVNLDLLTTGPRPNMYRLNLFMYTVLIQNVAA